MMCLLVARMCFCVKRAQWLVMKLSNNVVNVRNILKCPEGCLYTTVLSDRMSTATVIGRIDLKQNDNS